MSHVLYLKLKNSSDVFIHETTADDLYKFVNLNAWEFVI